MLDWDPGWTGGSQGTQLVSSMFDWYPGLSGVNRFLVTKDYLCLSANSANAGNKIYVAWQQRARKREGVCQTGNKSYPVCEPETHSIVDESGA